MSVPCGCVEEWRVVRSNSDFAVSNHGRVMKLKSGRWSRPGIVGSIEWSRYVGVWISKRRVKVHRLVAIEFIPNPLNFPHINHIDGNRSNNCVDNLEWVTPSGNSFHRARVLRKNIGDMSGTSKLCSTSVLRAREMLASGMSGTEVARKLGVHKTTIYDIIKGRTWVHLT